MSNVKNLAKKAKIAARTLSVLDTEAKNSALEAIASQLLADKETILQANGKDLDNGKKMGLSPSLLDRLALTSARIDGMVEGIKQVVELEDPVGQVMETWQRPNGLEIAKVRVPMGVIGMVYEARPNVTVDTCALCLKAGSAVVLRGSSSALNSNRALVSAIKKGLAKTAIPEDTVQFVDSEDRGAVDEMLRLNGLLDLVIPRGGAGLIRRVVENATVPVIETGVGNCHVYVDVDADPGMALEILLNAKCQRYGVCNAAESLLVHEGIAANWLPGAVQELNTRGVEIRGCSKVVEILSGVKKAEDSDWATEFLSPVLAIKVVKDFQDALDHIQQYSSGHSESIVTNNQNTAAEFLRQVDAAAVYHNASTRFTDGFEYGFGAEIGISTQKLHARGPMGLRELTSYKYVVKGTGQVRP
ncbi:glutamate-5-semialdehyde dehydrogenase [Desulforamulus reducens MI-1]|uniref:Gamma-glutamyl phosphate reductase n=1 Tax=Desulforamulus reducens (strain ATCC BAA-1160 / DSM 100696 / MI-1) TaxID=349161 RepID=PROA_DESRM|nr:glutamate-5-semialdehyde dehydrogenase [Desulforamulus reducens]A4J3Q0.1 RecName: Full=Gamma-glutamyl phosphate reductase; Short=GPR; AltName: Full=Glutamate-5-semialdehyde dehydrogenase; AltName: Full=Glutamyl-gamma-semialdehyde dehydrogenase; Short=GSA dehydrogenase [Desulforamulus reducens MI-1]ABO49703.1 glutamate-5-semialdehyde dehydrogenase [Desulforamulus reducens MI-1]